MPAGQPSKLHARGTPREVRQGAFGEASEDATSRASRATPGAVSDASSDAFPAHSVIMYGDSSSELPATREVRTHAGPCSRDDDEEDVSVEELQAQRVLARHGAGRRSAARESVATQELTTSGVRALFRDSRSSRPSLSSSIFEDPTYTMEVAKREVLDILAHDPEHEPELPPPDSAWGVAPAAVRRPSRQGSTPGLGSAAVTGGLFEVFEEDGLEPPLPSRGGLFEVFEEEGLEPFAPSGGGGLGLAAGAGGLFEVFNDENLEPPMQNGDGGQRGVMPALRQRSSSALPWDDRDFEAAMG